jgi:hypothetical protein
MPEIWCELDGVQFSRSNCKNLESPNPTQGSGWILQVLPTSELAKDSDALRGEQWKRVRVPIRATQFEK